MVANFKKDIQEHAEVHLMDMHAAFCQQQLTNTTDARSLLNGQCHQSLSNMGEATCPQTCDVHTIIEKGHIPSAGNGMDNHQHTTTNNALRYQDAGTMEGSCAGQAQPGGTTTTSEG